jgi:hypothetical protein
MPVRLGLIFVQQLAHLLDRHRRIVTVERLLAFALLEVRPFPGKFLRFLFLIVIARGANTRRCRCSNGFGRIASRHRTETRSLTGAIKRFGVKIGRPKISGLIEILRLRFLLDAERSHARFLVDRGAVGHELFVLLAVLHRCVGLEQTIHQFLFLVLGVERARQKQIETECENPHATKVAGVAPCL